MSSEAIAREDPVRWRNRMGERLRAIRREQLLTLAEVAERSGISIGTLSKVERGLSSLGYDRFSQLADCLGLDIGALFAEGERMETGLVKAARGGEFVPHATDNYDLEMLFPEVFGKSMVPVLATLTASRSRNLDQYIAHEGQEFVHVLRGEVQILFKGHEPLILSEGENAYFDSGRPHLYLPNGPGDARILVVCAGPQRATDLFQKLDGRAANT